MTTTNPVQDHIDALEADAEGARHLLDRVLDLAVRQNSRPSGRTPSHLAARTLRLAVVFHRRARDADSALDGFLNHLERQGR